MWDNLWISWVLVVLNSACTKITHHHTWTEHIIIYWIIFNEYALVLLVEMSPEIFSRDGGGISRSRHSGDDKKLTGCVVKLLHMPLHVFLVFFVNWTVMVFLTMISSSKSGQPSFKNTNIYPSPSLRTFSVYNYHWCRSFLTWKSN